MTNHEVGEICLVCIGYLFNKKSKSQPELNAIKEKMVKFFWKESSDGQGGEMREGFSILLI